MYKNPMMAHAPTVALIGALVYLWSRIADDLEHHRIASCSGC
jgi:hypothetical protein